MHPCVLGVGSSVLGVGSFVLAVGSSVLTVGSSVLAVGSSVPYPKLSLFLNSKSSTCSLSFRAFLVSVVIQHFDILVTRHDLYFVNCFHVKEKAILKTSNLRKK